MSHPTIRRKTSTERSIKTEEDGEEPYVRLNFRTTPKDVEVFVPSEFDWMGLIK